MTHALTREIASHFARTALDHVTREWPNKLDHVLTGPEDLLGPRALHPIFFGSFDWHSCVHGHWLLARLYRRFPDLPEAARIRALLDDQFTPEKVVGEVAYLARPSARGFERPYGWAWALMLQGELLLHQGGEGKRWAETLKPLADAFVQRFRDFLPLATYPARVGMHANTAFALVLTLDYAKQAEDWKLVALCTDKARSWYGHDADFGSGEPSQADFLSPTLIEALCMRRVLEPMEFRVWLRKILPRPGEPAALYYPATVSDRSDGQIAHLDGLNLSRAWCWRLITDGLAPNDPLQAPALVAVTRLIDSALPHVTGDYMGEHWLASFALLALDPYIA
jgi:hypothetical protein